MIIRWLVGVFVVLVLVVVYSVLVISKRVEDV